MNEKEGRLKLDVLATISRVLSDVQESEEKKKLLDALWKLHAQPLSGGGPGEEH